MSPPAGCLNLFAIVFPILLILLLIIPTFTNSTSLQRRERGTSLLEPKLKGEAKEHVERKCPGTCMSPDSCAHFQGVAEGPCVDGTICCQFEKTCGQTSSQLVSYFQSPGYPSFHNESIACMFHLLTLPLISALRIDFQVFDLNNPRHYQGGVQKCILDAFFVLNGGMGPNEGLCAMANYSSLIQVKPKTNVTLLFVLQSSSWRWRLKLTQLNISAIKPWKNAAECGRQLMYEASPLDTNHFLSGISRSNNGLDAAQPLIVNGEDAEGSEFPWQVSIQSNASHRCGGSILNKRFILTAAHCFADSAYFGDISNLRVMLGGLELNSTEVHPIQVDSVILNHEYRAYQTHLNDIAILRLSRDIVFSPTLQPVCLPSKGFETDGREGAVSGWGRLNGTSNSPLSLTTRLQKLSVRLLSRAECQRMVGERVRRMTGNRTTADFILAESQLCALAPPNSTVCFGDSGGPLVVRNPQDGTFTQVGVVSFGLGPCLVLPSPPVVYSRLSSFLDFIVLVIASS